MIDDLLKQFSMPVDMAKLSKALDVFWDQRDQLTEVVRFVSTNKDQLTRLLALARDHGDEMVELVRRLPELLGHAGSGIEAAGAAAQTASRFLSGAADDSMGADSVFEMAAGALDRCRSLVEDAGALVSVVSERLERIPLVDDMVAPLRAGGARVDDLAEQLGEAADRFVTLSERLVQAGVDLDRAGAQLQLSGGALRQFAGVAVPMTNAMTAFPKAFFASPPARVEPVVVTDEPAPEPTVARARRAGAARSATTAKAARARPAKQAAAAKPPAVKGPPVKKAPARKAAAAKNASARKQPVAKKASAKKAVPKKPSAKKAVAKKAPAANKRQGASAPGRRRAR